MIRKMTRAQWVKLLTLALCAFALVVYVRAKDDQAIKAQARASAIALRVANAANCRRVQKVADTVNPAHKVLKGIADGFIADRENALQRQKVALLHTQDPQQRALVKSSIVAIKASIDTFRGLSRAAAQVPSLECAS